MEPSKLNVKHRVSRTNCCIVGCGSNYSNTESVKFYRFPSKPHEKQRRMQWIIAVKRSTCDGDLTQNWQPKPFSRICSRHFVGNAKSNHPNNPSFLPTIFPEIYKKSVKNAESKMKRFVRYVKRTTDVNKEFPSIFHTEHPTVPETSNNDGVRRSEMSTQVNFSNIDTSFLFECEYYGKNEVATSCNIPPTNNIKTYVEKSVGPNTCEDVCTGFHGLSSVTTDEQLNSLTGVHFVIFTHILDILNIVSHGNEKNSLKDKLLMFLMKMKLGISYSALGVLFGVHRSTVQRIFTLTLEELAQKMKNYVFWPAKHIVIQTMPESFKRNYPNCRVTIDCTELPIQQPGPVDNRIFTYSHYKGTFTAKFLIGITPSGFVSFISKCYGGRSSDGFITNNCGILELLEKGDLCLADKGFPGVKCEDVIIVMPPFVHDGRLTEEEVERTYNVASVRIHVERAIQRVKTHGILHNFTNELLPIIDQIVFMCCVLANLQPPIIKNDNIQKSGS